MLGFRLCNTRTDFVCSAYVRLEYIVRVSGCVRMCLNVVLIGVNVSTPGTMGIYTVGYSVYIICICMYERWSYSVCHHSSEGYCRRVLIWLKKFSLINMCMWVCMCVCMCRYVCVFVYVYMYVCLCVYMCLCVSMYVEVCLCVHVCVYVYVYVCVCMYACAVYWCEIEVSHKLLFPVNSYWQIN